MAVKSGFAPVMATRQNHALEHATIALILQRTGVNTKIAGRAVAGGFYIYGNLPTAVVEEAAHEALRRLKGGERELAYSPFCGTNLAVAGVLAGVASILAMGGRNRLLNFPRVLIASMSAVLAAQPLGKLIQKHLTTSPEIPDLEIAGISKSGLGPWASHKIETMLR